MLVVCAYSMCDPKAIAKIAQNLVTSVILFVSFGVSKIGVNTVVAGCDTDSKARTSADIIDFLFHVDFYIFIVIVWA